MEATKKRISKKQLTEFINSITDVKDWDSGIKDDDSKIYVSKIDGSYITHVGLENDLKHFLRRGITEGIQSSFEGKQVSNIGFNPEEQKWYGWSHRAIFGFGIGSKCKKGDCGFKPSNKEEFKEQCLNFWGGDEYSVGDDEAHFGRGLDDDDNITDVVIVRYTYNDKVPNEKLRGTQHEHFSPFPKEWGKGEWTANTLEEAKQMAIDFAESVS